ncbi:17276_t:CDS:2, partial [Cetraspora pellucida]
KLMNSTQTFEEIIEEIQEQVEKLNKAQAFQETSITKEDLNKYFTEAIKLKWTINYQDSTDQIATLVSKAKTYYDWSKIIEETLIRNYDYIPIEYKSRVIYNYELISLQPTLVEIYNLKEVD